MCLGVLITLLLLRSDTMTKATLIEKESIQLGASYSLGGLVHYHHGGGRGSRQARCWRSPAELQDWVHPQ